MARYIDSILQPGEKLLYSTTIHGIIYVPGAICLLLATGLFLGATTILIPVALAALAGSAVFAIFGCILVLRAWFRRWTTETDVTNMRVVHKEGFISAGPLR